MDCGGATVVTADGSVESVGKDDEHGRVENWVVLRRPGNAFVLWGNVRATVSVRGKRTSGKMADFSRQGVIRSISGMFACSAACSFKCGVPLLVSLQISVDFCELKTHLVVIPRPSLGVFEQHLVEHLVDLGARKKHSICGTRRTSFGKRFYVDAV